MGDRVKTVRNVAILLAIAAAVDLLPGGDRVALTFRLVLGVVFAAALGYAAIRFYTRNRVAIYSLGEQRRALLCGAIGVGVVTVAARPRMWQTGFGEFGWFVLICLVVYTLVALYRYSRTY
jgi:hypothetical protein